MVKKPANKKPPSARSLAAKAKREKAKIEHQPLDDVVRQRIEDAFEKTWGNRPYPNKDARVDTGWVEMSYPSERSFEDAGLLSAEEAEAQQDQMLAKRHRSHLTGCPMAIFPGSHIARCTCPQVANDLNDDVPDFIYAAAKAGPPLNALGQTEAEQKRRRTGELPVERDKELPVIYAGGPAPTKPKRNVTIMRDHTLEFPDLYLAIFVAPDWDVRDDEARFARLFARSGCYRAETIEEADLVIFGGGSDVDPTLYGEDIAHKHPSVYYNTDRDNADMDVYIKARGQGTPMMGVCRGAQFLHVMNGGRLYQDIDGHQGSHKAFALKDKMLIENVSSVHHQSCVFNKDMDVLLMTSNQSKVRWLNADEKETKPVGDVEAFFYRDSGCFGVQGHPEYAGCNKFSVWCLEQINNLFLCSPDFTWEGKRLQMTSAARDAQKIAEQYVENQFSQAKEV